MLLFHGIAFSQAEPDSARSNKIDSRQTLELPIAKRKFRPKLSLQEALKLAESYLENHEEPEIDISKYFLSSAGLIHYGGTNYSTGKDTRQPAWSFAWAHEDGALLGNGISIIVLIESGAVIHLPTM